MRKPIFAALIATIALALTSCGASDSASGPSTNAAFNKADVTFATDMIPHHAQALSMVDLTQGRTLDPDVQALANAILEAQAPEIETMTTWLNDWDEPVPMTARDHMHAEDGGQGMEMADDMPGMMSNDEMTTLENASDADFQVMWLESMIRHHEGAIEMAKAEQSEGKFAEAIALAKTIEAGQTAEVATMKKMLG
jgi:uncharacterized protein (DUF305 family)